MVGDEQYSLDSRLGRRIRRRVKKAGMRWKNVDWPGFERGRHFAEHSANLAHELAHFLIASPRRRRIAGFGLGAPGSSVYDRDYPVMVKEPRKEEEKASLLGIALLFQAGGISMARTILEEHQWLFFLREQVKKRLRAYVRRGWITERTARGVYDMWRKESGLLPRSWS